MDIAGGRDPFVRCGGFPSSAKVEETGTALLEEDGCAAVAPAVNVSENKDGKPHKAYGGENPGAFKEQECPLLVVVKRGNETHA